MATRFKSKASTEKKNQSQKDWKEKIEKEYTYCMISTQNQMVNYLPTLLFDFEQTFLYLTLGYENSPQNKGYDKSLKDAFTKVEISKFPESPVKFGNINSPKDIRDTLRKYAEGEKVLWNITGGQRPFMMAIFELLKEEGREDDIVMYLEGNSGKVTFLEVSDGKLSEVTDKESGMSGYTIPESKKNKLTIPIALKLMGFKCVLKSTDKKGDEVPYTSFLNKNENHKEYSSINTSYTASEDLRKKLIASNRSSLTGYKSSKCAFKDESAIIDYFSVEQKIASIFHSHSSRTYPFGHLLEEMFAHQILDVAKDHIADMGVNIRLRYENELEDKEADHKIIDELDIAVLTKTGQLVVFEVKSGDMHSDVAKSTKYTTYAISGVYGKPILLSPLLKDQLPNLGNLEEPYKKAASAARAAKRAQLPIICLDGNEDGNFEEAITKLLNL